jgi:phospholipase C
MTINLMVKSASPAPTISIGSNPQSITKGASSTLTIKASNATQVTVTEAGGIDTINHAIFMLQKNHSFDNYFGMLNPYRRTKNWNVGDDGQVYTVDGIDDKLNTSNVDDEACRLLSLSSNPPASTMIHLHGWKATGT